MSAKRIAVDGGPTETLRVKRVLRRRGSQEYFKAGGWTADPREASSFGDALEAAETCVRYQLRDVDLALRFERAGSDVFCTPVC